MKRFLILIFLSGKLLAQNWAPVNVTDKYNYELGNVGIITNTLWVDSTELIGEDSVFYLNRIVTLCDTCSDDIAETGLNCSNNCFYLYNQPQFLQRKIIKKPGGIFVCKDTVEFIIKPLTELNDSWVFDSITNVIATITAIEIEEIFNYMDSIKYISLSSGHSFKLSKNFGILSFPEFKNDTTAYKLVGIEGRNLGEQVPDFWDFFDFNVGDVFQYHFRAVDAESSVWEGQKYKITEKTIYEHSIHYSMEGYSYYRYGPEIYGSEYVYWNNTYIDSIDHYLNKYNNQLVNMFNENDFGYNKHETFSFISTDLNENNIYRKSYGANRINSNTLMWKSEEYDELLVPSLSEDIYRWIEIYGAGVGQMLRDIMFFEEYISRELVGYIKNGDTVGTITPDSLLWPIKTDEIIGDEIKIFPNPVSDVLILKKSKNYQKIVVEIFDINGKSILQKEDYSRQNKIEIMLPNIHSGIYFVKIRLDKNVFFRKLIKN